MDIQYWVWDLSLRAADLHDGGRVLGGMAVPYEQETVGALNDPLSSRVNGERVLQGAFSESLLEVADSVRDIVMLVDHDPARLLARTRSRTLEFIDGADGLRFHARLPDTSDGRDVYELARRGDLGGVSMGFSLRGSTYQTDERGVRTLEQVDLREISIVSAFPSYLGTSVEARARARGEEPVPRAVSQHRDEVEAWIRKLVV